MIKVPGSILGDVLSKPTPFERGLYDVMMSLAARLVRHGVMDANELAVVFGHVAGLSIEAGEEARAQPASDAAEAMRAISGGQHQREAMIEGEVAAALRRAGGDL